MNTIQQVARQAADAEYRAWHRQEIRTTEDVPLVERVADAVAVAVLREVKNEWNKALSGSDSQFWLVLQRMLAAFTPAEQAVQNDTGRGGGVSQVAGFTPAEPPPQETRCLMAWARGLGPAKQCTKTLGHIGDHGEEDGRCAQQHPSGDRCKYDAGHQGLHMTYGLQSWSVAPAEPQTPEPDDRIYPCRECGVMRSKAEGGTTFTVCDECWNKHAAPVSSDARPDRQRVKWDGWAIELRQSRYRVVNGVTEREDVASTYEGSHTEQSSDRAFDHANAAINAVRSEQADDRPAPLSETREAEAFKAGWADGWDDGTAYGQGTPTPLTVHQRLVAYRQSQGAPK